jgi:hypothetical protein
MLPPPGPRASFYEWGYPPDAADLTDGLPFIDLHMTEAKEFAIMLEQLYASDRDAIPKVSSRMSIRFLG